MGAEAPTLLLIPLAAGVTAYAVAVYGVARNRRGEPPYSIGVIDRITRYVAASSVQDRRHQSAFRAQLWYEWQRKGWAMPVAVGVVLFMGLIIWASTNRDLHELVQGLVAGGGMIALAGFLSGLVLGNTRGKDDDFAIGSFLASRPMTNSDLARATLATAAISLLIAWLYAMALRRGMIHRTTLLAAAFAWAAACAVVVTQWPTGGDQPLLPAYALVAGALAIAVAPFAAAPLAIAWNRHR